MVRAREGFFFASFPFDVKYSFSSTYPSLLASRDRIDKPFYYQVPRRFGSGVVDGGCYLVNMLLACLAGWRRVRMYLPGRYLGTAMVMIR